MCYTLTQKEYVRLKGRLTKAINSKDEDKIIAECDYAVGIFEKRGYPDDWARWKRAKDDALFSKQRKAPVKW
jgi:hypothetical protein